MAFAFQRKEVDVKVTGKLCSVPSNPKAKLMYYLSCMKTVGMTAYKIFFEHPFPEIGVVLYAVVLGKYEPEVLDLAELPSEYTNYSNYYELDDSKVENLLEFCKILSPDKLEDKCISQVNQNADLNGSGNKFLELSSAKTTMVATSSVMMAGREIQVTKIMLYKPIWRRNNYDQPMAELSRSLVSRRALPAPQKRRSSSCVLL